MVSEQVTVIPPIPLIGTALIVSTDSIPFDVLVVYTDIISLLV